MTTTKQVGSQAFTLLDDDEIECEHKYESIEHFVLVNPSGEFVVGYGNSPVFAQDCTDKKCTKCGYVLRGEK